MICAKEIFSAVKQFLHESQELGVIHEFSLSVAEELSSPEFEKVFNKFLEKVNKPLDKKQVGREISKMEPDKAVVQIQINKTEMQRRISAFKSWKRKEVEECNVQEFCSHPYLDEINPLWGQLDSCSRVDTVFMPRFGSKGHYKVSKVENRYGPNVESGSSKKIKKEINLDQPSDLNDVSIDSIQERLQAMESHLKLKTESTLRCNVIQRLKKLEDKILFLEGISPDYLHYARPSFTSPQKKADAEKEKLYANLSFNDLQKRIQTVKDTLKCKSVQLQKENPE